MYEEYFGLTTKPFSIVPDPRYFFMSGGHSEALAHLLYGINSEGGFVLLTGEVGTGKTTVCRRLLEIMPEEVEVAFILNPKMTAEELLATICDEFGIGYPEGTASIKVFVARINDYLLGVHERGRRAILIIEEAQNLTPDVLEQIRLLTNLETNSRKLLQIIMLGQPELREMLARPELRQLSQRITARYHLGPLSPEETGAYVDYRLSVAGWQRGRLFPQPVVRRLFRLTRGVPRLINVICDRALLGAYVQGKERVDMRTLMQAAREVSGEQSPRRRRRTLYAGIGGLLLLLLCAAFVTAYALRRPLLSGPGSLPATSGQVAAPAAKVAAPVQTPQNLDRPGDEKAVVREAAYGALFEAWGLPYREPGGEACLQAQSRGLECAEGVGSISELRAINRPAVLTFFDEKGSYYGTLLALSEGDASVALGKETRRVPIGEIERRWRGEYLLLWRPPSGYSGGVKPGSRGPVVGWLARQLALAEGRPAPSSRERVYDGDMVNQVKRFQTAAGLTADGLAGPKTIMRLTAAAAGGEPSLSGGNMVR